MKLYKDSSLKEPLDSLDLGVVKAGESKQFEYFVYNNSKASLENLKFFTDNNNLEIPIKGNKLFHNEYIYQIKGIKNTNFINNVGIIGKKDINNILVALEIF